MPTHTWLEEHEHAESEEARASALAKRWTQLTQQAEQRQFREQADREEGCGYDPLCDPCGICGGHTVLGVLDTHGEPGPPRHDWQVGIDCPGLNCEDGWDMSPVREYEQQRTANRAEHDLDLELIEDKLQRLGARMMRPYEHWNEDESYVEYMECGRFGD